MTNTEQALDDIMEDLMVGHNFEYAREAILDLITETRKELLEKLLENGHGGGNWRRIITEELEKL